MKQRLACVGHRVYFQNHFCERSSDVFDVTWIDFDHYSTIHYARLREARPDVTVIFRPELHDATALRAIPGVKIGVSSEPFPKLIGRELWRSSETDRRLAIFKQLSHDAFDGLYHYDVMSKAYCESAGMRFDGFGPLPINIDWFSPGRAARKPLWDMVFVGKVTPRRQRLLDPLKNVNRDFLWVEHGITGQAMSEIFKRAACVVNIHADDIVALEPRVYLAAACGVPVLSEPTGTSGYPFEDFVVEQALDELSWDIIDAATATVRQRTSGMMVEDFRERLWQASGTQYVLRALREVG